MKNKIRILVSLAFVYMSSAFSQDVKVNQGNNAYNNYSYIEAIKIYEKVAEKGYKSLELFQRLGNSYYFNANFEKSAKWYEQMFAIKNDTTKIDKDYYYRYYQSLKALKRYDDANKYLDMFSELSNKDMRAILYEDNRNYMDVIKENSGRYVVNTIDINSKKYDYGVAFLKNDRIVFSSSRNTLKSNKLKHSWTGQSFLDLYECQVDTANNYSKPKLLSGSINTKYDESSPVFTKDGKTMYFTRSNYYKGKKGVDDKGTTKLKIFRAEYKKGKWKNIFELPFNNDQYNVAHPALSADEKTLYFSSDMPGTIGSSDLFKVAINDDGTYGKPINLGKGFNTEGRETFPFMTENNELFFASDGHLGLGGLDIFVAIIEEDGTHTDILNVGKPVNSSYDDFYYGINNTTKKGYFTSNRPGGKGFDDIYSFEELEPLIYECDTKVEGVIENSFSGQPIEGVTVSLYSSEMKLIAKTKTNDDGQYEFTGLDCNTQYFLRAEKEGYETNEVISITKGKHVSKTKANITLSKQEVAIEKGIDLANVLDIQMIFFDYDKYDIRKDAEVELAKLIETMRAYPNLKIEVGSHTDSRAREAYNQILSEKRAKATLNYIVKKGGIDRSRITAVGYGEMKLVNGCSSFVKCTEEEHQQNRRSEFKVINF